MPGVELRATNGHWVVVFEDRNPCPAVLQYLNPSASVEVPVSLPAALEPAAYRVRFPSIGVREDGGFVTATQVGDSFVVRP